MDVFEPTQGAVGDEVNPGVDARLEMYRQLMLENVERLKELFGELEQACAEAQATADQLRER